MRAGSKGQGATIVNVSLPVMIADLGLAQPPGNEQVQAAAAQAFVDSVEITAYVAAGFVFLGLLATLALPPQVARRQEDQAVAAPAEPAGPGD